MPQATLNYLTDELFPPAIIVTSINCTKTRDYAPTRVMGYPEVMSVGPTNTTYKIDALEYPISPNTPINNRNVYYNSQSIPMTMEHQTAELSKQANQIFDVLAKNAQLNNIIVSLQEELAFYRSMEI